MEVRGLADGPAYLLVQAPAGTTWTTLAPVVRRELGLADRVALRPVGGGALGPATVVGVAPLQDGLAVTPYDGARGASAPPGRRASGPGPALAHLVVTGGPDTGREFALTTGTHVLGRSTRADLRVDDPGLSRRHVALAVTPDGVRVHDLGSVNGTRVDDAVVGAAWTDVGAGCLLAGGSSFRLRPANPSAPVTELESAALASSAEGVVFVPVPPPTGTGETTPPRSDGDAGQVIRYPPPPAAPATGRAALVTAVAPLAMALALALALRTWLYLIIGLLGPVTLLGQLLLDRRSGRPGRARRHAEYAAALAEADRALAAALDREREVRRRDHPSLPEVLRTAETRGPGLWQGGTGRDGWSARVGCGTVTTQITVERDGRSRRPELAEAPLTVRLDGRATALCGSRRDVAALGRAVIIQLAVRHDLERLRLRMSPAAQELLGGGAWPAWLPQFTGEDTVPDADRDLAVVRSHPGARAVKPERAHGVLVLVDDPGGAVPDWCDVTVRVAPDGVAIQVGRARSTCPGVRGDRGTPPPEPSPPTGRAELLASDRADAAARALAPLRPRHVDGPPGTAAPRALLAALHLPDDVPALTGRLRQHWSAGRDRDVARVVLGDVAGGPPGDVPGEPGTGGRPCELDLDRDGPHLLLAGMTGSGKSELLATLVAGLVLAHPPEELALVLMDYKGGSTFAPFAALPHTVGLLTDLEPEATARALRALGAELRHRETLFGAAGVTDARGYRSARRAHPDLPPLPRLVVVVDEYRVLAEDHPSALSALVRIAGLGRGLGVHLVLATQRPGGIVSAEIRANVNARIAMRVRDVAESHDVLDVPDAARLDPHIPGRGYLRVGSSPPVAFQAVRAAASLRPAPTEPLRVTRVPTPGPTPDWPAPPGEPGAAAPSRDGDRVVDVVVAAATEAARHDGHHRPPPVWAAPLPERLAITPTDGAAAACEPTPAPAAWPYGLADAPDGRRVEPLLWRPAQDGHLALVGTSRSGRTAAVLAVLAGLATACPSRVRVAVVDAAGGLDCAGDLPHCVGRAGLDDLGAVRRLLDRVSAAPRGADDPSLTVLVLHGWEQLGAALDTLDHGRATSGLIDLLRAGPAGRLRVLLTGDRGLLTGAISGLVEHKVVLRLADPRDALLAGVRPVPGGPGRGVHLPGGEIVQLAASAPEDLRRAGTTAAAAHAGCRFAPRPPALPRRLSLADVPPGDHPDRLVIGRDADGAPAWVDAGSSLLIAGPRGSGRSTVLETVVRRAGSHGRPVHVVRTEADLAALAPPVVPGRASGLVLVDDLDELPGPLVERLGELAIAGVAVVAATRTSHALVTFTGVVGRLRRGDALILWPTPADGQLVGVTLGPGEAAVPGRACLVRRGRVQVVQVAVAEPAHAPRPGRPAALPEPRSA